MHKAIGLLILVVQTVFTLFAMVCVYMVFAILDSEFGLDGLVGLTIVQPILALILSSVTIFACLIVGLPIRISRKLTYWWMYFYVPFFMAFFGLTFLLLSLLPGLSETIHAEVAGQLTVKQVPNTVLCICGWFMTAFSLLHIFPSPQLTEKAKVIFQHVFKTSLILVFVSLVFAGVQLA